MCWREGTSLSQRAQETGSAPVSRYPSDPRFCTQDTRLTRSVQARQRPTFSIARLLERTAWTSRVDVRIVVYPLENRTKSQGRPGTAKVDLARKQKKQTEVSGSPMPNADPPDFEKRRPHAEHTQGKAGSGWVRRCLCHAVFGRGQWLQVSFE